MKELWKDIQGYDGLYQVSNLGRVRSVSHMAEMRRNGTIILVQKEGKILTPLTRRHGYLSVMLYGRGGHPTRHFKQISIHRLVAEAFVENPNGYDEVNHIDECKTNNRADNLEWCDRKYNVNYGTTQSRRSESTINLPSKSKRVVQKTLSGDFVAEWPSMAEIERQTGYSKSAICNCCQRKYGRSNAYGYTWSYTAI